MKTDPELEKDVQISNGEPVANSKEIELDAENNVYPLKEIINNCKKDAHGTCCKKCFENKTNTTATEAETGSNDIKGF